MNFEMQCIHNVILRDAVKILLESVQNSLAKSFCTKWTNVNIVLTPALHLARQGEFATAEVPSADFESADDAAGVASLSII